MPSQPAYFRSLYPVAESQDGFFTAKQALEAGYSNRLQTYHVQNGDWIREARGIFRLDCFPPSAKPELMVCYLWSCNRKGEAQGVFSHETALSIYSLSSWNSQKIHLTVPAAFQRMVVPEVIQLHRRQLRPSDVTSKYGVAVTKPLRAIIDLLNEDAVPRKYLIEAVAEALEQKLILPREIAKSKLADDERKRVENIIRVALK